MTNKDYVRAAKIVQELRANALQHMVDYRPIFDYTGALLIENSFVKLFVGDDPTFDETRFREACRKA